MPYWEVLNYPGRYGCYAAAKGAAMRHSRRIGGKPALILYRNKNKPGVPNPPANYWGRVNHYVGQRGKVDARRDKGKFVDHPAGKGK